MGYYDYASYFQTMINNQNSIITSLNSTLLYLQVLLFMFVIYFLWRFISKSINRRF